MYKKCTRNVPEMYKKCTRNVQEMYKKCTRNVQEMYNKCTRKQEMYKIFHLLLLFSLQWTQQSVKMFPRKYNFWYFAKIWINCKLWWVEIWKPWMVPIRLNWEGYHGRVSQFFLHLIENTGWHKTDRFYWLFFCNFRLNSLRLSSNTTF